MRKSGVALLCVGACVAVSMMVLVSHAVAQEAQKSKDSDIALCDVKEVLANYPKARDLYMDLQKRRGEVEMEDNRRRDAIENIESELGQLRRGGKEWERRFAEMQKLNIDREVWLKYQNGLLMHEHHRITRQLYEEISVAAGEVAKERGFSAVLSFDRNLPETASSQELGAVIETRSVLWMDEQVDITEDVLKQLTKN